MDFFTRSYVIMSEKKRLHLAIFSSASHSFDIKNTKSCLYQRGSYRAKQSKRQLNSIQNSWVQNDVFRKKNKPIWSITTDCPDYPNGYSAFSLFIRLHARLLLQLRVRAIRVVDELLVQSQRLLIHESLAAAIALDRSIELQANVLEGSITAQRQRSNFRHE